MVIQLQLPALLPLRISQVFNKSQLWKRSGICRNDINSYLASNLCNAAWMANYAELSHIVKHSSAIDINGRDQRSYTALHYSCSNGSHEITSLLLERVSKTTSFVL